MVVDVRGGYGVVSGVRRDRQQRNSSYIAGSTALERSGPSDDEICWSAGEMRSGPLVMTSAHPDLLRYPSFPIWQTMTWASIVLQWPQLQVSLTFALFVEPQRSRKF